ncbi:hypothetical protein MelnitzEXVC044M_213 [Methylophilales phage Melnitz EXVC044M]|nr:hypothetical protein Melnitz1EXVC043M_212 [Methylophilales phage Melnitz-1 EXVC043M]QZI94717.1 hypothetical protein Melnitz2EXVC040M_213 [Methylophilales phage Melnitz-2 EXVC040M]QZI94939.1 hypothetical protein MelnitzEXVC044M_213 [Methylophilales phage Melnitz EXVC044M]QZI95160.1 hypothetical protein Melnitz3EXVC039M_213 [Methylophilales phage Melnitz-3 EXVC039M]
MTEYKILKLQSGEEIICDVVSKEHPRTFEIKAPLKVNVLPRVTKYGVEESISLQRWIHFSEENIYNIDKNKVMVITQASTGLSKFYEHCIQRMDAEGQELREREPSNMELDEIEAEEWDEDYGEPDTRTLH